MYCFINARTRIDIVEWKAPGVERIHNRPLALPTSCHRRLPRASRVLHCSEQSSDQRLQQHELLAFPRRQLNRGRKTLHSKVF